MGSSCGQIRKSHADTAPVTIRKVTELRSEVQAVIVTWQLFDGNRLRKVPRLVNIGPFQHGNVIRQQLQGYRVDNRCN